ncbi:MAG TPA: hypothetical protein VJN96_19685 [Vicinamibacterales bacterium]|nr:hypothetical protein [Vicinamibacterales bacterium]
MPVYAQRHREVQPDHLASPLQLALLIAAAAATAEILRDCECEPICPLGQTASSPTFERIQINTSSSTQATAFAEILRCFGNSPLRSIRQIVDRERPVRSRIAGNLNNFNGRMAAAD